MSITILDVIIGMAYVYVLFSILSSGIVEWISRLLNLRARLLKKEIPALVGSDATGQLGQNIGEHPLVKGIQIRPPYPTYIPPQHFALALIDLAVEVTVNAAGAIAVTPKTNIQGTAVVLTTGETSLVRSLIGNDTSIRTIQAAIEKWFTDSMERLSGAYKRQTYVILLFVSIAISALFGIDSIRLARDLYANQPVREALVKSGQSGGTPGTPLSQLPIGWTALCGSFIPGCLLTGFALTLGAPFWFDLLSRLANLRQTGVPPDMKGKIVAQ